MVMFSDLIIMCQKQLGMHEFMLDVARFGIII